MFNAPPVTEISGAPLMTLRFSVPAPVIDRVCELESMIDDNVILPLSEKLPAFVGCAANSAVCPMPFGASPSVQFESVRRSPGLAADHVAASILCRAERVAIAATAMTRNQIGRRSGHKR